MISTSGDSQLREADRGHHWSRTFKLQMFVVLLQFMFQALDLAEHGHAPDAFFYILVGIFVVLIAVAAWNLIRNWWTQLDEVPTRMSRREIWILALSWLVVTAVVIYNFTTYRLSYH